jgi:2-amino-4-hydroxy-6-hydroxymethyldihydropteridine diphosphokinase
MKNKNYQVLLILGSSLEDGNIAIQKANISLSKYFYVKKQTDIFLTEAFGVNYTDKFFNQAVIVESELSPKKIIARISRIEKSLGQKRKDQLWGRRIIDIDVIYIENLVYYDSYIQIPHEGIYDRPYIKQLIKKIGWNYEKF